MADTKKYYVYFYYIDDKLVYVGRTVDLIGRYKQHLAETNHPYDQVNRFKVIVCQSEADMILYEKYYIMLYNDGTLWNVVDTWYGATSGFKIIEPEMIEFSKADLELMMALKAATPTVTEKPKTKTKKKTTKAKEPASATILIPTIFQQDSIISWDWLMENIPTDKKIIILRDNNGNELEFSSTEPFAPFDKSNLFAWENIFDIFNLIRNNTFKEGSGETTHLIDVLIKFNNYKHSYTIMSFFDIHYFWCSEDETLSYKVDKDTYKFITPTGINLQPLFRF